MSSTPENTEYSSIWEIYGLRSDPFSTSPLLVKGGSIPQACFMGRDPEVARLRNLFRSYGGSRVIVCGSQGVGKTTLVNMARLDALNNHFFTPFQEIKMHADWSVDDFLINSIQAIYSAIIKIPNPVPELSLLANKLKPVFDAYEKQDKNYSLSISSPIGGMGGGYGTATAINAGHPNSTWLTETFQMVVSTILNSGYREVILHYNNLDDFDEDEEKLKRIFNRMRDVLQTEHVHFVFVGSPTTSSIISSIPRVSNILSDTPIHLQPLSVEEVRRVISMRITSLGIDGVEVFSPVSNETIELLYGLHRGNLRAILNSFATAVREVTNEKPILLTPDILRGVLFRAAEVRLSGQITPTVREVLLEMLQQDESTNMALAAKLGKQPQNISVYLSALKESQCITLSRVSGREKFYSVEEWVKWLRLKPDAGAQLKLLHY